MADPRAFIRMLEAFTKDNVSIRPNVHKETGKAVNVPRPKGNLQEAPGPVPGSNIITPKSSSVDIDEALFRLSQDEQNAVLARGAAEIQNQTIGAQNPLITPRFDFHDSGVPISDKLLELENIFPGANEFKNFEGRLINLGGQGLDSTERQGITGAGHLPRADFNPNGEEVTNTFDVLRARILEFQKKKGGNAPELVRGINSSANFEQLSNIGRSFAAGKGGFDPFDPTTEHIDQAVFFKANKMLQAFMQKVQKNAGLNPAIQRSRELGPSSSNFAAQKGLDQDTFSLLNPTGPGKDGAKSLDDIMNALKFSREGPPTSFEAFGTRSQLTKPGDDIKLPDDRIKFGLEDAFKELRERNAHTRQSRGGNVVDDLYEWNSSVPVHPGFQGIETVPPGPKKLEDTFDRVEDRPSSGATDDQRTFAAGNDRLSAPTLEEAAEELGLTIEEAMDALKGKMEVKLPKGSDFVDPPKAPTVSNEQRKARNKAGKKAGLLNEGKSVNPNAKRVNADKVMPLEPSTGKSVQGENPLKPSTGKSVEQQVDEASPSHRSLGNKSVPKQQVRPDAVTKKGKPPEEVTINKKSTGQKSTKSPTEPVESQDAKKQLLEGDTLSAIIEALGGLRKPFPKELRAGSSNLTETPKKFKTTKTIEREAALDAFGTRDTIDNSKAFHLERLERVAKKHKVTQRIQAIKEQQKQVSRYSQRFEVLQDRIMKLLTPDPDEIPF